MDHHHVYSRLSVRIWSVVSEIEIEGSGLSVHDHVGADETKLWHFVAWNCDGHTPDIVHTDNLFRFDLAQLLVILR